MILCFADVTLQQPALFCLSQSRVYKQSLKAIVNTQAPVTLTDRSYTPFLSLTLLFSLFRPSSLCC